MKPLDTVARNSLLIIHGKQELRDADGHSTTAMQWLVDVLFNAPVADQQAAFVIRNPDVLGLFGWEQGERKDFSYTELSPFLKQIDDQADQSDKLQAAERSAYQNQIINLRNALMLYQRLKNSVQPEGAENFTQGTRKLSLLLSQLVRKRRASEKTARLSIRQSWMMSRRHSALRHAWLRQPTS